MVTMQTYPPVLADSTKRMCNQKHTFHKTDKHCPTIAGAATYKLFVQKDRLEQPGSKRTSGCASIPRTPNPRKSCGSCSRRGGGAQIRERGLAGKWNGPDDVRRNTEYKIMRKYDKRNNRRETRTTAGGGPRGSKGILEGNHPPVDGVPTPKIPTQIHHVGFPTLGVAPDASTLPCVPPIRNAIASSASRL